MPFLIPPWVRWAALGLIAAALFASGFQVSSWRCEASQKAALEKAQREFEKQLAEQNEIARNYEEDRERVRTEYITREGAIREVYRDVPAPGPECAAPDAVRELLDNAVQSANGSAG